MAAAVADALTGRGFSGRDAIFVSQAATAVFTTAVDEWARKPERGGLAASIQDALGGLRTALGSGEQHAPRRRPFATS